MNLDFRELLLAFNDAKVEYLIVGAHALAAYGHVRATKDLDIWVRPSRQNAERVMNALTLFGAPLNEVSASDLTQPGVIFQIGLPPLRIDLITSIDGVEFADAWRDRFHSIFGDVPASIISRRHLIVNKKAVGRLQDLADVERLEKGESQ
jgi:hypothetical protein